MLPNKTNNPINRVKCVVETCKYWLDGNNCVASAIEVQRPHATSIQSTDCATFENRAH